MKKKPTSKLKLNKETLLNLQQVTGGQVAAEEQSEGVKKCLRTDCSPCDAYVTPADPGPYEAAPLQPGEVVVVAPRP